MEKLNEDQVVEYDIKADFSETEAIRHKKFGIGIITSNVFSIVVASSCEAQNTRATRYTHGSAITVAG